MAYDVTLVQFNGIVNGISTTAMGGFTPSFNYLLSSMWICAPSHLSFGGSLAIGSLFCTITCTSANVQVSLATFGSRIFAAQYSGPIANERYNLLVSANCVTQTVQVYLNDAIAPLTSGGWTSAGTMGGPTHGLFVVDCGSSGGFFPAGADFWMTPPDSFVDLTVVSNRRKFINSSLAPVYLGGSGDIPFGSSPPVFLTVPPMGVPTDFQTNFGTGGPIPNTSSGVTLSFQEPGTCFVPKVANRPMTSIIGRTHP